MDMYGAQNEIQVVSDSTQKLLTAGGVSSGNSTRYALYIQRNLLRLIVFAE